MLPLQLVKNLLEVGNRRFGGIQADLAARA